MSDIRPEQKRNDRLEDLLRLFLAQRKSDLRKLSREVTIDRTSLSNLILASDMGLTPWQHTSSFRDYRPPELELTEDEIRVMAEAKKGRLEGKAKKAFGKIPQIFSTRRLLVGHMFYTTDHSNWHFIYFDQRDTDHRSPHWKHGSHLHMINHLWPQHTAVSLWKWFNSGNVQLSGAIHIRFLRQD